MRIRLSRQAERDLVAIGSWLADRNPRAANELIETLRKRVKALGDNPMIGPLRDDVAKGMRGYVVAPYLILYRVEQDELLVVRIVDGRRDLNTLF
jgi:toxin ParE1/3/4